MLRITYTKYIRYKPNSKFDYFHYDYIQLFGYIVIRRSLIDLRKLEYYQSELNNVKS